jgi:alkylation response protein AidB-like acyl-CoA dehydrogenase
MASPDGDQPSVEHFRTRARDWLDSTGLPPRDGGEASGVASDAISVFHDLPHDEELALLDRLCAWQRLKCGAGYGALTWPAPEGAGLSAAHEEAFTTEELRYSTPGTHELITVTLNLIAPTLRELGSAELRELLVGPLLRCEVLACQLFSEPGAGSDLAGLRTRAERDGDHYVVNGQKLWTSNGHRADWMFALVRTDPNAKKQKGITYLLIDMKSPGLQLRPIVTLDGEHHTNETFFDNVRVPVANRIGEENRGWDYAKFLLGNERAGVARVGLCKQRILNAKRRAADIIVDGKPLSEDARFREKMALIETELKALEITNMMVVANMKKQTGHQADPRASVLKIKGSELQQATLELMFEAAGPGAMPRQLDFMMAETDDVMGPDWSATAAPNYYFSRAISIFGGSNEIQHNIVSKAILGL